MRRSTTTTTTTPPASPAELQGETRSGLLARSARHALALVAVGWGVLVAAAAPTGAVAGWGSNSTVPVDLSNASIPPICGFPAAQLVRGEARFAEVPEGGHETIWLVHQVDGDLDGDGTAEVAGLFNCNWGGTAVESLVLVFRSDLTPIGMVTIGQLPSPGYDYFSATISTLQSQPGSFKIDVDYRVGFDDHRIVPFWLGLLGGQLQYVAGDGTPVLLPPIAGVAIAGSDDDGAVLEGEYLDDMPTWQDADADEAAGLPVAWITDQFTGEGFRLRCTDIVEYFVGELACEGEVLSYFQFLTQTFPDGFAGYVHDISEADLVVRLGDVTSLLIQRPLLIAHLGFVACYAASQLAAEFPQFEEYLVSHGITIEGGGTVPGVAQTWNAAVGSFCGVRS